MLILMLAGFGCATMSEGLGGLIDEVASAALEADAPEVDPDALSRSPPWTSFCSSGAPSATLTSACAGAAALSRHGAHATIQDAIDTVTSGDVVLACPGTHTEALTISKDLRLGAVDRRAGATVLSGGGSTRVVDIGAHRVSIFGVTVADGYHVEEGGGIYAYGSDLTLVCDVFEDNRSDYAGGALALSEGAARIAWTEFSRNFAESEGGAISFGGLAASDLTILSSLFTFNEAGYAGGAVSGSSWAGDAFRVRSSRFLHNFAEYEGGALALGGWEPSTYVLSRSVFTGNYAGYSGGAVDVGSWAHDEMTIDRSVFEGNSSDYEGGAVSAGSWDGIDLAITSSAFTANDARSGGALELGGWAPLIDVQLTDTTFDANTAEDGAMIEVGSRVVDGTITMDGGSATSNAAGSNSAAIVISPKGSVGLTCTRCDLGSGATDNSPHDVLTSAGLADYGSGASFTVP